MSHEHNEIILPPVADVEKAVAQIMSPFNERSDDEDHDPRGAFWDWYQLGGRWSGCKTEAALDPEAIAAFNAWLHAEKVMVKGMVCGKQELADATTIAKVDAKWREMFPGAGEHCIMFQHASPGNRGTLPGDICTLAELPERLNAFRVIIAGPLNDGSGLEAVDMISDSVWNGVRHVKTAWDGKVVNAVDAWRKTLELYSDSYRKNNTPQPDWLVVTVDTHT